MTCLRGAEEYLLGDAASVAEIVNAMSAAALTVKRAEMALVENPMLNVLADLRRNAALEVVREQVATSIAEGKPCMPTAVGKFPKAAPDLMRTTAGGENSLGDCDADSEGEDRSQLSGDDGRELRRLRRELHDHDDDCPPVVRESNVRTILATTHSHRDSDLDEYW